MALCRTTTCLSLYSQFASHVTYHQVLVATYNYAALFPIFQQIETQQQPSIICFIHSRIEVYSEAAAIIRHSMSSHTTDLYPIESVKTHLYLSLVILFFRIRHTDYVSVCFIEAIEISNLATSSRKVILAASVSIVLSSLIPQSRIFIVCIDNIATHFPNRRASLEDCDSQAKDEKKVKILIALATSILRYKFRVRKKT